jgi:hypothetical protein
MQTTGHFDVGHQTRFCKCMIYRILERKSNVKMSSSLVKMMSLIGGKFKNKYHCRDEKQCFEPSLGRRCLA